MLNEDLLQCLRCPIDGQALKLSEDGLWLVHVQGLRRYPVSNGIAMLLAEHAQPLIAASADAEPSHG